MDVVISGQFGLEHDFDQFIGFATRFIDSQSKLVRFDIHDCKRMWPSAITLLCSFRQWTEITAHKNFTPTLASNDSKYPDVNSYLAHCGFYNYVRRNGAAYDNQFDNEEIVKIKRENNKSEIDEREESICNVLDKFSTLSADQVEDFDCNVLIEAFNNVTEHGHSIKDSGWWSLTQYHKTTGIISLCIADNGIGIKNSLLTGPQKNTLKKLVGDEDGKYILKSLEENTSGALTGSTKDGTKKLLLAAYERGSRRGNGLKRIQDTCARCGIEFCILSQKGYLKLDAKGAISKSGTTKSTLFAGTLYHFIIPGSKFEQEAVNENN
jgi:hypothetical protein